MLFRQLPKSLPPNCAILLHQVHFDFLNDKNLVLCSGGSYQKWNVKKSKFIKKTETERYRKYRYRGILVNMVMVQNW